VIRPATLRAMPLPEIRQRIAAATAPAQLDQLAAECDRRPARPRPSRPSRRPPFSP
jgi:hypothetical protein